MPLALYFKDGYAKVEIALARGKKSYDKRHALAERQATRETERAVSHRARGRELSYAFSSLRCASPRRGAAAVVGLSPAARRRSTASRRGPSDTSYDVP